MVSDEFEAMIGTIQNPTIETLSSPFSSSSSSSSSW